MNIYYDEEGDFLEMGIDNSGEGYFKDIGEGVSERIDKKTGKVVGIAIMSFKKRTEKKGNFRDSPSSKIRNFFIKRFKKYQF